MMSAFDYTPQVLDHFIDPRNVGDMDKPERTGTAGTPGQGPHAQMFVKLGQANGDTIITDIRFKTWGCPALWRTE